MPKLVDEALIRERRRRGDMVGVIDHANPNAALDRLQPSLIAKDRIELKAVPPASSSTLVTELTRRGMDITRVENPFRNYRQSTYIGKNRELSNSDIIVGKPQLYESLDDAKQIISQLKDVIKEMLAYYEPMDEAKTSIVAQMEMEDLGKITIQAWKPTGWFLASPITEAVVPKVLDPIATKIADIVGAEYGKVLKRLPVATQSWEQLVMQDDDPSDTMTGSPLFASGERSHEARIAVLSAMPDPTLFSPREYYSRIQGLEMALGIGRGRFLASVVSTRHGPMKKPVHLWTFQDTIGYQTRYDAVGMYDRTRFVYPAAYQLNFLLSPLYVQMSSVRKNKLGLWHDPESQDAYIAQLQKQGTYPYAVDFSGMDTGMLGPIIHIILRQLQRNGFCKWSAEFFDLIYDELRILFPDYYGDARFMMECKGPVKPWCSGFKLTSEFDTFYGLCVVLGALADQDPTIISRWQKGDFIIAELGDDVIFTLDKPLDVERFSKHAMTHWGATLKVQTDAMFLKWFLPIVPEVKVKTRSLSRLIQQTFFNEDRYAGVEGGDKPDAILRLGLQARMAGLKDHPHLSKWWPKIARVICQLGFVKRASDQYRQAVLRCDAVLDNGDELEILKYAQRNPTYITGLQERSKYEPSAAFLLRMLEQDGVTVNDNPSALLARKAYMAALKRPATAREIAHLKSLIISNGNID